MAASKEELYSQPPSGYAAPAIQMTLISSAIRGSRRNAAARFVSGPPQVKINGICCSRIASATMAQAASDALASPTNPSGPVAALPWAGSFDGVVETYMAMGTPALRRNANGEREASPSQRFRASRTRNPNEPDRKPRHDRPQRQRSESVEPRHRCKDSRPELDKKSKQLQRQEENKCAPQQIEETPFDVLPDGHGLKLYRHRPAAVRGSLTRHPDGGLDFVCVRYRTDGGGQQIDCVPRWKLAAVSITGSSRCP